jgi:hypothetical protein
MFRFRLIAVVASATLALVASAAHAGVVNPDISVIGQPFITLTNDPAAADHKRPRIDVGETEIVFDAPLNPYAHGNFTMSLGTGGLTLEEGYFTLVRGLPAGLALKGGQYRTAFGHLNPTHPHALPFAERFGVLAAYLPGDEALIERGVSLSRRVPIAGDFSVDVSADWLQGDTFRIARAPSGNLGDPLATGGNDLAGESRPAFNGRISGFQLLGDQSGIDFGVSATGGTNNVAAGARTRVFGVDAKAKLWTNPRAYLVLQGEVLHLDRDVAAWNPATGYRTSVVTPTGGYVFADYAWATRYDAGASYEVFQRPTLAEERDQSVGAYAGLALLEESTVFRGEWRRTIPDGGDAFDTYTLRVIYSMGPHKAHQF